MVRVKKQEDDGYVHTNAKNYFQSHKIGQNSGAKEALPRWEDPNPVKYNGTYGYINLKNM